jgi:very-short-patch-repair endonuclease
MADIDKLLLAQRVLNRGDAAARSSRATVSRRIGASLWWRPTSKTVAPLGVTRDNDFWLSVGSAHVWPRGGLAGRAMALACGLTGEMPDVIDLHVPADASRPSEGVFRVHESKTLQTDVVRLQASQFVTVDAGPGSVLRACLGQGFEPSAWLLIHAVGSARSRSKSDLAAKASRLQNALRDTRRRGVSDFQPLLAAVADGCQSAGEVAAWLVLKSLRLEFVTQQAFASTTFAPLNSSMIYVDFWVPKLSLIIEADSGLHDHQQDVRRDLANLVAGRRTLRIVGRDVIADPLAAQTQIAAALRECGWRGSVRPLGYVPWNFLPVDRAA